MLRIYSIHNVMFILHRVTGVALLLYLILHVLTISTALIAGGDTFDFVMQMLGSRGFLALDIALFGALLFHTLNGLRIIMTERDLLPYSPDSLARATAMATLGVWLFAIVIAVT